MSKRFKTTLIWGVLIGLAVFGTYSRQQRSQDLILRIAADQALEMIDRGDVSAFRFVGQRQALQISTDNRNWISVDDFKHTNVVSRLNEEGVQFLPEPPNQWRFGELDAVFYYWIGGGIVVIAVLYFLKKFRGGQMNTLLDLRKSKARAISDENKALFTDIGGNQDAVELLKDVVDFLRNPAPWVKAGTRLPRGILVVGAPGTGKTLLARAVAGETNSSFFYASAGEFVEMFVGVGAARIRDTFEKAIAKRPAVIFIDEIDAIGRRRGSGSGAMHEEREQTLNQLLVLMDGLEQYDRLVVMAATNRPDVLDPALLRSGRFDRTLRLATPDFESRVEILRIHTRNKPLEERVSIEEIAKQTDGMTGADLEGLTNDAALLAVRRHRDQLTINHPEVFISMEDFRRAFESMSKSNPRFDRLDSILVESVTQFAEPTGKAVARITLTTGTVIEGDIVWMNAGHIKLRTAQGTEVILSKQMAEQIAPLEGTELASSADFVPDRWASVKLSAR